MRFLILFFFFPFASAAQQDTIIDDTQYKVVYFNSGEPSTLYPVLKPGSSESIGKTSAFNLDGEIIYENEVRQISGFSKVKYAYYESGAVKAAQFSSHPDGGIQRTYIVHYFDEKGKFLKKEDLSDEGFGPELTKEKPSIKNLHNREIDATSSVMTQNNVYHTRAIIVNTSSKKIKFLLNDLTNESQGVTQYKLKPGDTIFLETYTTEEAYDRIETHFYLQSPKKRSQTDFSAKSVDTFPEGNLLKRLTIIQLYRRSDKN